MSRTKLPGPWIARLIHALRVGVIVALLLLIPSPTLRTGSDAGVAPGIEEVQAVLPNARSLDIAEEQAQRWAVRDATDKPIGSVVRTLPAAKDVVGYRGPTEAAIILDTDLKIVGVRLLGSADTAEHVEAVRANQRFFEQFKGWPWGGPGPMTPIDGVSGATLTSLALAEAVLKRIDGNLTSLLFPRPLSIDELKPWFPKAHSVDESRAVTIVKGRDGQVIGHVLRTGPLCDDVTGYRGPTELLMKLSVSEKGPDPFAGEAQAPFRIRTNVEAIKIRSSFDNEPFTGWVRDELGFWEIFTNRSLEELGKFDTEKAGVEGVSGATMTSLAVADTIVAAAAQAQLNRAAELAKENAPTRLLGMRFTPADAATGIVLFLAALASHMHWFRYPAFRKLWLLTVLGVIGFWGGNLISLALISGWAAEGIAWQLAPGLAAIAALSLIAPPSTGANPYCHHLCPHGAIQQLIKPRRTAKRKLHPPRKLIPWLRPIPAVTLVTAYLSLCLVPTLDLSSWEPFHAYLIRIAPAGAIALALATLAVSALIPMGYCRFGCPTGSLLDYLRRSAHSGRLKLGDGIGVALLVFSGAVRWMSA